MDVVADLLTAPAHFTRRQALARGETDRTLLAAVRAGTLVRLRHGAYVPAELIQRLDRRERHLVLARAALAQQQGAAALAGPSAALLRGFDVFGHDLDLVHVVRLDGGSSRRQAGVVHHVAQEAVRQRVELHDGVCAVGAADAVWQTALVSSLEGGVVTVDSALHQQPDLAGRLHDLAGEVVNQPRSRTARLAMRLARKESESVGESLTRVACYRHGVPAPELQHDVVGRDGGLIGRTDFWWEEFAHLGEFDGKIKYGRLLKKGQTSTDAVVKEKRREDRMRALGLGMSRFAWSEVQPRTAGPRMTQLRRELDQSRRLYVVVTNGEH